MALLIEDIGCGLVRTCSDIGMKVERDGVRYDEAVDPADKGRTYIETNEPIVEVTESDKDAALRRFGVEV